MRVERITAGGFMSHDALDISLPAQGVVVVTGDNGAGKSSVIEAVATCVWGKTLRGSSPWREGSKGSLGVDLDGEKLLRAKTAKGRAKVAWLSSSASYDTAKAAQTALDARWGDLATWRRTSVFSSADADAFTGATDAERKRLLERLLGLGRFDAAHKQAREDLREERTEHEAATREVALLRQAVTLTASIIESTREAIEAFDHAHSASHGAATDDAQEAPQDVSAALDAAREAKHDAAQDAATASSELRRVEREIDDAKRAAQAARRALGRLESMGECPTCQQSISEERLDAAREVADAAAADAETTATSLAERVAECAELVEEATEEIADYTERVGNLQRAHAAYEAHERVRAQQAHRAAADAQRRKEAAQRLTALRAKLDKAEADVDRLDTELAEALKVEAARAHAVHVLSATERVLGTRGVRAQVTAKALGGLEAVANHWLAKIANAGITITLSGTKALKSGGSSEVIDLQIHGAGGGHGYQGASAGERRRIDVALLFALAETAAAASGRDAGTLWVDEAFDSLDVEGVASVVEALEEIAKERCVVVITHNADLAAKLPAASTHHFRAGI